MLDCLYTYYQWSFMKGKDQIGNHFADGAGDPHLAYLIEIS
jgi:hypothetical protein